METFIEHVKASSARGAETLRKEWIPECCQIIDAKRDDIEAWMPLDDPVSHERHYGIGEVDRNVGGIEDSCAKITLFKNRVAMLLT